MRFRQYVAVGENQNTIKFDGVTGCVPTDFP